MKKGYKIWKRNNKEEAGNELRLMLPIEELALGLREDVEALSSEVGLIMMQKAIESEIENLIGKKSERIKKRKGFRWGEQSGYVVFGGRKMPVMHSRVRDEEGEVELKTYQRFQSEAKMQKSVRAKMLAGVSTKDYGRVLEDFCKGYGIKKSSVSPHWIKATEKSLQDLCERSLKDKDFCVLMIDGIEYSGHLIVVALGIDREGNKTVLGLWEGATENTVVCQTLLEDLIRRGLNPAGNYLAVIDGSKALKKSLDKVFGDQCEVQRCQIHKRRNLKDHLPEELQSPFDFRIRNAYGLTDYDQAKTSLLQIVEDLKKIHPSAASSLEEGMEETLTVHKLKLPEILRKSLCTTNAIESCFSVVRHLTRNVKYWRPKGNQVQRWVASSLLETERRFKKIKGYRSLSVLVSRLDQKNIQEEKAAA